MPNILTAARDYNLQTDQGVVSFLKAATNLFPNIISSSGNLIATTDPGVSNDITQGYAPGLTWVNLTANRVWMCLSNAKGAAVWLLDGVVPGVGIEPSSMLTQFGNGTQTFPEEGNIYRSAVSAAASISPGSTGNDNVLFAFTLPASSFDVVGRGVQIEAAGSFAANGDTKEIKVFWGCTTATVGSAVTGGVAIADTGAVVTSGGGWNVSANVFKYGAAGSNTQVGIHTQAQIGPAVAQLLAPQNLTANEAGAIIIAVTGNTTTATTDILANWCEINAMN
jgi:hypothetical protein